MPLRVDVSPIIMQALTMEACSTSRQKIVSCAKAGRFALWDIKKLKIYGILNSMATQDSTFMGSRRKNAQPLMIRL